MSRFPRGGQEVLDVIDALRNDGNISQEFRATLTQARLKILERSTQAPCSMTAELEQLRQLIRPVWDGNLISKSARSQLVKNGYVAQAEGWSFLTEDGIRACVHFGFLKADQPVRFEIPNRDVDSGNIVTRLMKESQ